MFDRVVVSLRKRMAVAVQGLAGVAGRGTRAAPADPAALLALQPGRVTGLEGPPGMGLTRLGLAMLADPARHAPVAYLDVQGWLCPAAAWEAALAPERLVVVRCADPSRWAQVAAALCEGVPAVYAEVPAGMKEPLLRRLAALARSRRTALALRPLRGALPGGLAHLRLTAQEVVWDGPDAGHGRLGRRRLVLAASGKAVGGATRLVEVEDDGTHDLRVVPRLAAPAAVVGTTRRAAG